MDNMNHKQFQTNKQKETTVEDSLKISYATKAGHYFFVPIILRLITSFSFVKPKHI